MTASPRSHIQTHDYEKHCVPVWCDAHDDPLTTERENLPGDRKTPGSLQRNKLHVWRGCVQWGLISTQVRSERKQPKESELKSCSCFITQQQVPWTAINYQPTSRRQSPLFPPQPRQLASIPVQAAVCQRLIYTCVFCLDGRTCTSFFPPY